MLIIVSEILLVCKQFTIFLPFPFDTCHFHLEDASNFFLADLVENLGFEIDPSVLGYEPYNLFE